jgi:hypothetical protein
MVLLREDQPTRTLIAIIVYFPGALRLESPTLTGEQGQDFLAISEAYKSLAMTIMDGQLSQTFQCLSTGRSITIPVQKGTLNEPFVYWSDIQCVFENAKFVKKDETLVPFMKDDVNHIL